MKVKAIIGLAAGMLAMACGAAMPVEAAEGAAEFSDVSGNYWAAKYISFAAEKGIINGYGLAGGHNLFVPENQVSYEETAAMLYRALEAAGVLKSDGDFQAEYEGLLSQWGISVWARPYVAYFLKYNIISENELKEFVQGDGPGNKAPRQTAAAWVAKAMEIEEAAAWAVPYIDSSSISEKYRPYVDMLYRHGIMAGSQQEGGAVAFLPEEGIKRSEFAAISNRVYDSVAAKKTAFATGSGYYDVNKETASYRGKVSAVDSIGRILSIQAQGENTETKVYITDGCNIVIDGNAIKEKDTAAALDALKDKVIGREAVVSTLAGNDKVPIAQLNIDTKPSPMEGTVKSVEKASTDVTIIGIDAIGGNGADTVYYVMDSGTASEADVKTGAHVKFLADGVKIAEII